MALPTFLPGRFILEPGRPRDYFELERFHYRPGRPATWAGVWVVRYGDDPEDRRGRAEEQRGSLCRDILTSPSIFHGPRYPSPPSSRVAAVGVLSYPTPNCAGRQKYFNLGGKTFGEKLRFANANLRTISRVVVHPQFRSLGLAAALVRHICNHCPTRYVEALAVMGRAHPFFEKAGMTRIDPSPTNDESPVYYILDRQAQAKPNHSPAQPID